jgi:putative ubiquitin-RnfH superfamily antitoxin RatB of RatAB toxin-antitoxin module
MSPADRLHATVVFCLPERQHVLPVELPTGATLRDAVLASGLLRLEPWLSAAALDLGVFNTPRPSEALVRPGDRIEVYRPLTVDPKVARRVRAQVRRRRHATG